MEVISADNVHQALPEACYQMCQQAVRRESRNGDVWVMPSPMSTVYRKPTERVVFWEERDANPFFHLMESLWILAGRNDVEWISRFSSNIANYSDDGKTFNGAYGQRWRHFFRCDQLELIVDRLTRNPDCRRQVLSMWAGEQDLPMQDTKDVPCNLVVPVQIGVHGELNIMVANRSNDLIWGAHGANAVQFSVLLEVLAGLIRVPVGTYTQVSMNTHIYDRHWSMANKLAAQAADVVTGERAGHRCPYRQGQVEPYPMVTNPGNWMGDLDTFMDGATRGYHNDFFGDVALPMMEAWFIFKDGKPNRKARAMERLEQCRANDWARAGREWLARRKD